MPHPFEPHLSPLFCRMRNKAFLEDLVLRLRPNTEPSSQEEAPTTCWVISIVLKAMKLL